MLKVTDKSIRIGLIFGGKSGEHEVSIRSAENIRKQLIKNERAVKDIYINKEGDFDKKIIEDCDVIFPIMHGSFGEDGCLQGLLEMLDMPYVGAGVLGSALGMDKDVQKRLLMQAGIPVAKYKVIYDLPAGRQVLRFKIQDLKLNFPVFVKPANMGSSVGISKCKSKSKLKTALEKAFLYDTKVLAEEEVRGREIEVSVLGNDIPAASLPGEIIPQGRHEFYDYEAKYVDENGAKLEIPVKGLSKGKIKEIQDLAIKTFKVLECEGMARVDLFLQPDGRVVVNEVNTLPGFTNISMYPKLWEVSGLSYSDLLDRLIELAFERKKARDRLKRSYQ